MDEKPRFNKRRLVLQIAFWFVLVMLLSTVVSQVINIGNNEGQSAYGDDWNDMSAFRQDVKDMGIDTKSLVSSPLLLADIEDPANTTFIIAGVEEILFHCLSSHLMVSLLLQLKTDTHRQKSMRSRIRIRWRRCPCDG